MVHRFDRERDWREGRAENIDAALALSPIDSRLPSLRVHARLILYSTRNSVCAFESALLPGAADEMVVDRHASKAARGFVWLWILLTFLWFAANSSYAFEALLTGALISAVLAWMFTRKPGAWRDVRLSPKRAYHFGLYTGVFLVELVRANINMMRYVFAPRINIRPGIVRIKTQLRSPVGRLALANSIALTPGSLVIDIKDEDIFVHWLDVKTTDSDEATRAIAGAFEKHLEKTFG
jgi:multicomponent Na+:H+ antiporter subunit E